MKQRILFFVLLCTTLITSCNKPIEREPGSYADKLSYATIRTVEHKDDAEKEAYIFVLGDGTEIFLADNTVEGKFKLIDGERIVMYYSIIEHYDTTEGALLDGAYYGCDTGLRLFAITNVHTTKTIDPFESLEEANDFVDNPLEYIYTEDYITYGYGFINIIGAIQADDLDYVDFYLIQNPYGNPTQKEERFLNLELRYSRGTSEPIGKRYEQYIGLDLSPFADQLEDKDGVILRVVTQAGTGYFKVFTNVEPKATAAQRVAAGAAKL